MPGDERGLLAVARLARRPTSALIDDAAEARVGRPDRGGDRPAPLPRRGGREGHRSTSPSRLEAEGYEGLEGRA